MEELEKNLTKANNNVHQKQLLIDGLNQSVDKLKRKVRRYKVLGSPSYLLCLSSTGPFITMIVFINSYNGPKCKIEDRGNCG